MKTIVATSIGLLFAAVAAQAQNTERNVSVPDAVPACMERNGPDCLLKSETVSPRIGPPTLLVVPPATPTAPAETSGAIATTPTAPKPGLVGSGNAIVVSPSTSSNPTSSGFTTNPNSIGGNLQSSGGTSGNSTSSGFTTNPGSVGGALQSGPASTPATNTTGAGSVRR